MKRLLYMIAVLVGLISISACTKSDLGLDEGTSYPASEPVAEPTPAADLAAANPLTTFALAAFEHGLLHKCAEVAVKVTLPAGRERILTNEQIAYALALYGILSMVGKAVPSTRTEMTGEITQLLQNIDALDVSKRAELTQALSWPPAANTDQGRMAAAGELVKVHRCRDLGRFVFGTCVVEDLSSALVYTMNWRHYDLGSTVDSDKGFTLCSRVGGQWSAPSKQEIDRERLDRMIQERRARPR